MAYGVYKLWVMPMVFYEANDYGQAKSRRVIKDFPVLIPDHLGYRADPMDDPKPRPRKR